jgi:Fe2+ transport system protein FeoA
MPTLDSLKVGEVGKIVAIQLAEDNARRLSEMGLTVGASIRVHKFAPFGDPMEVVVRGYHLSLRKAEAKGIVVE